MKGDPHAFILYQAPTQKKNTSRKGKPGNAKAPPSKAPKPSSNPFVFKFEEEDLKKITKPKKPVDDGVVKPLEQRAIPQVIDMNSYNIFHIDSIIKDKLTADISKLPSLESDLMLLLGDLSDKNVKNKLSKQQELTMLRKRIQDIQNTFALTLYIYRTADLLEKYSTLQKSENSRSFVYKDESHKSSYAQEIIEKNNIVSQYISIAREYVEIENYKRVIDVIMCPICKTTGLTKSIEEETSFLCKCGFEYEILDDTPSFKDTDRVNMSSRYTYTRRGHFIEAIKKYQGKHNIDPEALQSIVAVLHKEMSYHHLTPKTVTKDHLYMFLAEKKLCDNYEDINILYHIITGHPCPEFSHLEGALLELFEEQEKALVEVTVADKNDNRVNSINVYYKLYKLLQRLGYPCKKTDFYILKTKTNEDEHDEKMRKAWEQLDWPWIDT